MAPAEEAARVPKRPSAPLRPLWTKALWLVKLPFDRGSLMSYFATVKILRALVGSHKLAQGAQQIRTTCPAYRHGSPTLLGCSPHLTGSLHMNVNGR